MTLHRFTIVLSALAFVGWTGAYLCWAESEALTFAIISAVLLILAIWDPA